MPGRDGTGPMGQGEMTGRGLGNCIKAVAPLATGMIAGLCFGFGRRRGNFNRGRGFGRGFGWRNRQIDKQDNKY